MDEETRQLLKDALEELEEREWACSVDIGTTVIHCLSCNAANAEPGTYGVTPPKAHSALCTLKGVMTRIKAALG
jgi:hypothetical protein